MSIIVIIIQRPTWVRISYTFKYIYEVYVRDRRVCDAYIYMRIPTIVKMYIIYIDGQP